jgi:hypothetical protein
MDLILILVSLLLSTSILKTVFESLLFPRVLYPKWDMTHCPPLTENPKRLWAYWREGPDHLSVFTKQTMQMWKHLTDKYDWEIRLLHGADPSNTCHINNFIPREKLPGKFDEMYPQISSDAVRLALMALHGGIYMDTTIVLLEDLDHLFWNRLSLPEGHPNKVILGGFYNYNISDPGTRNGLEPWMLSTLAKEPLFVAWQDLFKRVMNDSGSPYVFNETTKEVVHPLLKGVDLSYMFGWANYLCVVSVFKAILTFNPNFNEQYKTMSQTLDVWATAFRLYKEMGNDNMKVDYYLRQIKYPSLRAFHHVIDDTPIIKLMAHARWLQDEEEDQWSNPATLISMIRFYIASRS